MEQAGEALRCDGPRLSKANWGCEAKAFVSPNWNARGVAGALCIRLGLFGAWAKKSGVVHGPIGDHVNAAKPLYVSVDSFNLH